MTQNPIQIQDQKRLHKDLQRRQRRRVALLWNIYQILASHHSDGFEERVTGGCLLMNSNGAGRLGLLNTLEDPFLPSLRGFFILLFVRLL
mmetsp:Transcript_6761/g.19312  ORF Transcript_6761/g.19312 Transcript_6761/m.19312 type:complete len:90 (+) Transcript_6761:96-365(+)